MEEIVSIPFWLVYTLSHCGVFFGFAAGTMVIIGFCTVVFAFVMADKNDTVASRHYFASLWLIFPLFFIFGVAASICPSQEDFKTYVIIKCCNQVLTSDIGKSSQEAITGWLTTKVEEQFKATHQ